MDLLDLYHAHDHSLALGDFDEAEPPAPVTVIQKPEKGRKKPKTAKFVPWEPYKAAPAHDRKGEAPKDVPSLIPYTTPSTSNGVVCEAPGIDLVDGRRLRKDENANTLVSQETVSKLEKQVAELRAELEAERMVNQELKSIFLKSLGDDFQCEVEALAGDKVHLGRRLEEHCEKLIALTQELEEAKIDADVWHCKFKAQSIRCDELAKRLNSAATLLSRGQDALRAMGPALPSELRQLSSLDVPTLLNRSPCDPRLIRKAPNFSNLTVTCCRNCTGREIVLL